MKKVWLILVAAVLTVAPPVFAEEYFPPPGDSKGVIGGRNGEAWRLGIFDALTVGGVSYGGGFTDTIQLPLASFFVSGDPITAATAPGTEVDDLIPGIVWADGETTPAQITFRVPANYSSGGAFKVLATESDSTTPNQVDFSVYINSDGTAADSAATDQTPVVMAGTTSTPDEITLSVTTDFSALSAGKYVTLNIWRDNVADGTGDLEVKGVVFYYTAAQ